ncbi:MAG: Gfo/Idh/MocA family oxidoreductase, partial [Bacteroidia bacterium]|nr:Gfo/Idh/MocA family oxidoreductase [Bacteroidia bacterium]
MKIGVIGYGSIGNRHIRNLISLGCNDIVLLRTIGSGNEYGLPEFSVFGDFVAAGVDAVILANPTGMHITFLGRLLQLNINTLVEKPLVATLDDLKYLERQLKIYSGFGMTAYNMRFHPAVKEAKMVIDNDGLGRIYSARFHVGQYLPDWRPDRDYRKTYSASVDMGGGVLFDLIHEIDLACYLIGKPDGRVDSRVKKVSDLQIETEDLAEIMYSTGSGAVVTIHLDYLAHGYRRYFEIVGEKGTLVSDLNTGELKLAGPGGKLTEKAFRDFE